MKKVVSIFFFLGLTIMAFPQDSYALASSSKLTIEGTSTVQSWTVTANQMIGILTLQDEIPVEINFEVSVSNILSARGATMDKKMHAALKKDEHPKITFELNRVQDMSALVGILTVAGKKKNVEINAEILRKDGNIKIKGEENRREAFE
jgi:hypothetical protein